MSRGRWMTVVVWGVGLILLAWALRQVNWTQLWDILRGLSLPKIALLTALNALILLALTARWRAFVSTQPQKIAFATLFQARLAAFSLSYFTPGPQFGGEPLQVLALKQRQVPLSVATATVALDKLVELLTNFTVLALGVVALWWVGLGEASARVWASMLAVGLLVWPVGYLGLLWLGRHPLAAIFQWLAAHRREGRLRRGLELLAESERLAGQLARERPAVVTMALLWAGLAWALMLLEFGLSAHFLGAALSPAETLAALAAARLAFLLPMPGGLGALASSQLIVFTTMGYDPNAALALVIYIRARDVIIGLIGALSAGRMWHT